MLGVTVWLAPLPDSDPAARCAPPEIEDGADPEVPEPNVELVVELVGDPAFEPRSCDSSGFAVNDVGLRRGRAIGIGSSLPAGTAWASAASSAAIFAIGSASDARAERIRLPPDCWPALRAAASCPEPSA